MMGDTSSPCWQCGDRSGCCSCPDDPRCAHCRAGFTPTAGLCSACAAKGAHVDHATQQGGFERPDAGMDTKQCPRCGSPTVGGFGLMGGGYGAYLVCSNTAEEATNLRCGWFYKEQSEPEQTAPHTEAVPDSVFSVIVRYVPVANGGPRHELITTCDRCGTEDTAHWGASHQLPDRSRREFDGPSRTSAWMLSHRQECKR